MTVLHIHRMGNHGALNVECHGLENVTTSMKRQEDSHPVALTGDGVGKALDESDVSTTTLTSDEPTSLWKRIERVRTSGKVFIDGTNVDVASVIAVGK